MNDTTIGIDERWNLYYVCGVRAVLSEDGEDTHVLKPLRPLTSGSRGCQLPC